MGVAAGMGAPLPIVAGAVVSGAYFGDKMSPLSDTTNLAPIAQDQNYMNILDICFGQPSLDLLLLQLFIL